MSAHYLIPYELCKKHFAVTKEQHVSYFFTSLPTQTIMNFQKKGVKIKENQHACFLYIARQEKAGNI